MEYRNNIVVFYGNIVTVYSSLEYRNGYRSRAIGGLEMINFEEELKKFQPSLEVEEAEDAIYNRDLTDMTDILLEMMKEKSR